MTFDFFEWKRDHVFHMFYKIPYSKIDIKKKKKNNEGKVQSRKDKAPMGINTPRKINVCFQESLRDFGVQVENIFP